MAAFIEKIKNQPVIIGGVVGGAIIGALQSLAGHGVIGQDVVDTAVKAVGENGWVWPIVISFIASRFSWGPVSHAAALAKVAEPGHEPAPDA